MTYGHKYGTSGKRHRKLHMAFSSNACQTTAIPEKTVFTRTPCNRNILPQQSNFICYTRTVIVKAHNEAAETSMADYLRTASSDQPNSQVCFGQGAYGFVILPLANQLNTKAGKKLRRAACQANIHT